MSRATRAFAGVFLLLAVPMHASAGPLAEPFGVVADTFVVWELFVAPGDTFQAGCSFQLTEPGWGMTAYETYEVLDGEAVSGWLGLTGFGGGFTVDTSLKDPPGSEVSLELPGGAGHGRILTVRPRDSAYLVRFACASRGVDAETLARLNGTELPPRRPPLTDARAFRVSDLSGGVGVHTTYGVVALEQRTTIQARGHLNAFFVVQGLVSSSYVSAPSGYHNTTGFVGLHEASDEEWTFGIDGHVREMAPAPVLWALTYPEEIATPPYAD